MSKMAIAFILGVSLALVPAALPVMSPQTAEAAEAAQEEKPNPGLFILDLVIVRPVSIVWTAAAYITYPVALLVDPLFRDDPKKLKEEWLDRYTRYTFERPLGKWKFGGGKKMEKEMKK